MNINENLKQIINEEESKKTKYGCVMLFFEPTQELADLKDKIVEDDVYSKLDDNGKEDYGIDQEPHCTALYGCEKSVTDEDVEGVLRSVKTPQISVKDITLFENEFDVVKFDIKSDELNELNKGLREFPYTSTFDDYHPHCTICYAKSGKGNKVIEDIGGKHIKIELKPSHYVYSKVDGTKLVIPFK